MCVSCWSQFILGCGILSFQIFVDSCCKVLQVGFCRELNLRMRKSDVLIFMSLTIRSRMFNNNEEIWHVPDLTCRLQGRRVVSDSPQPANTVQSQMIIWMNCILSDNIKNWLKIRYVWDFIPAILDVHLLKHLSLQRPNYPIPWSASPISLRVCLWFHRWYTMVCGPKKRDNVRTSSR